MRARGVLMSKTKIVVIDNDKKAVWELSKSLECEENIEVVSVEENGIDGLEAINKYNPHIVIMELLLTGIDGFSIIDYIKECKYDIKIILTSVINQQNIVREAFDKGIDYFVVKPYDVNTIVNRVKRIIGENKNSETFSAIYSVDSIIANSLIQLGIPASLKGYRYVATGIKRATEDQGVLEGVTKILYPDIAKEYDSTPQRVEKAIRHAIEVAWNKNSDSDLKNKFCVNLDKGRKRPTNSEFIATMSQYIINSYR